MMKSTPHGTYACRGQRALSRSLLCQSVISTDMRLDGLNQQMQGLPNGDSQQPKGGERRKDELEEADLSPVLPFMQLSI